MIHENDCLIVRFGLCMKFRVCVMLCEAWRGMDGRFWWDRLVVHGMKRGMHGRWDA